MSAGERHNDLDSLVPIFRHAIEWLEFRMAEEGLHFVRWETGRHNIRQALLFHRGTTKAKPGDSPHNHGLAADYVLDTNKVGVRSREWPKGSGKSYPDAWDYHSPNAADQWRRFGELVKSIGLEWGGDFQTIYDPPHVQMPHWRRHVP